MATATVPHLNPRTRERMEKLDHHLCGDVLFISSATEVGKMYKVTRHGCMCKAFTYNLKCYHADIYCYLMATQPQPSTAGPRTPDEIDEQGDRHEVVARPVYRAVRRSVDPEIAIEAQMDAVRALGPRTYTQADYDDIC